MDESKKFRKYLDNYINIILDCNAFGVKIEEDDQSIILLSSMPKVMNILLIQ